MTDLLFIEIGAVVTEILGPNLCTIEPFCDPQKAPSYDASKRIDIDFADSLPVHLGDPANAKYDQIVGHRAAIGPGWPGGGYEGILCVLDQLAPGSALALAANTLAGQDGSQRCRYQVIASVANPQTVRRYHGFRARVIDKLATKILFQILDSSGAIAIDPATRQPYPAIAYDKDDANVSYKFYAGDLVDDKINIVSGVVQPQSDGAVFMNLDDVDLSWAQGGLPKQPPSAGL